MQFETFINTTLGEKTISDLQGLRMFGHEYLQHEVSSTQSPEISLQTLRDHLSNPFNMANTSISQSLIAHELKEPSSCCIVDCSKCPEIDILMSKATVLKGYEIEVKTSISDNQAKALYDMQTLRKMIEIDFGMNAVKPAFLGEISLEALDISNPYVVNSLRVYAEYSLATGCPIIANCISSCTPLCLFDSLQTKTYEKVERFLEILKELQVTQRTVIFNLPFSIVCGHQLESRNISVQLVNTAYPRIQLLRAKWGITVGYDLLRYNDKYALQMIGHEITQFPSHTVLSSGVLFKTDTCSFGGEGYYCDNIRNSIGLSAALMERVCKMRYLELFNWKKKTKVAVEVKYWKCTKCGKEAAETVQSFKKFGKEFCSVPCIRNYNF